MPWPAIGTDPARPAQPRPLTVPAAVRAEIAERALRDGRTERATLATLLAFAVQHCPPGWRPARPTVLPDAGEKPPGVRASTPPPGRRVSP